MSYYVEYSPEQAKRYPLKRKVNYKHAYRIMAGILLSCVLMYCFSVEKVRQFLIPGDPDTTIMATAELFENIQNGAEWADAFADFCQTVIIDGQE